MRLILVRHGQTTWNEKGIFRGRADVPLDETGIQQARAIAERLALFNIERIYSSPLQRAWETAQIIAKRSEIRTEMENNLIDMDFGDWEGLTIEQVRQQLPGLYEKWLKEPHTVKIPNGEDLNLVKGRVCEVIEKFLQKDINTIGIVSHRAVLKIFICTALSLDLSYFWRIKQDVGAITILDYENEMFCLSSLNDTCHFDQTKNNKEAMDF